MAAVDRLAQLRGKNIKNLASSRMPETSVFSGQSDDGDSEIFSETAEVSSSAQTPHLRPRIAASARRIQPDTTKKKSLFSAAIERCSLLKRTDPHSGGRSGHAIPDDQQEQQSMARQETVAHQEHHSTDTRPKQIPGWVSPNYSCSRAVQLSPSVVLANRGIMFEKESATVDAYKILRTQILQRLQQTNGRTIMITSAVPGEGKTVTSINLAFTFAREFQQTVLLVDGDLQQQKIHQYLGYESDRGLINYLLDDCPVSELFTWPGIEKITIVSGGRTFKESSEILGAPRMRELIDDMKSRYPERYVFFDVQSILSGADALVFAPMVDHVLLVVEEGRTSLHDIRKTVAMLPEGKLLGVIINRHRCGR